MQKKVCWFFFAFYAALFGAFCGLEVDTFVEDLPFFQLNTFLLLFNVLSVLLIPPLLYALFSSRKLLREKRTLRTGLLVVNSLYFHLVVLLLLYKAARDIDFDFYFFWYNLSVALSVLWRLFAPWLIVIAFSVPAFVFFQKMAFSPVVQILRRSPRNLGRILAALTVASVVCQIATLSTIRGSTAGFLYANFLADHHLKRDYQELYRNHIKTLQTRPILSGGRTAPTALGDTIIFVQQESLGGLLVGPQITPQLLRASRDGILFNRFYGNSIQSERGYECILCGVPPSVGGSLVDDYSDQELSKLSCLPRIFKTLGYHALAFYSGNWNPRVTRLLKVMGFEKILADDIMKPGDIMYDWGYREDTFFTRVDEYLQKHYVGEKLFIFITASATNHTPFKVQDARYLDKVPFPQPKKFEEHFSNTTFIQDAYLGHLYDIFREHYSRRGTLVAVSDHAWPIPIHKNNIFNERGAFEENFLAAMLFVPPSSGGSNYATGTLVSQRFSQMDIVPTVLDLIGLKQNLLLGESFAPWLLKFQGNKRIPPRKTKISVQPYGGGFVSAVRYPEKYLFDVIGRKVKVCNLETDPREQAPVVHDMGQHISLIRDFFLNDSGDR